MNPEKKLELDAAEQLQMLQLLELKEWVDRSDVKLKQARAHEPIRPAVTHPAQWSTLGDAKLYPWQAEAIDSWFRLGNRGIAKVVTGAGKTVLGLAAVERLQKSNPELRVAIVVPTIVLLSQWREEIIARSNIPSSMIGCLGGGADDGFDDSIRILICVLNSAARKLPEMVRSSQIGENLLLIVDECHRAGALEMRRLFETPRRFTLGLSATPERDDLYEELEADDVESEEANVTRDDRILDKEIGPIFFEMNYAEAIERGVLAAFTIEHYALSLTVSERQNYESLSEEIVDLRRQLETRSRRGLALIRWCRSPAGSKDPRARRLISLITERKQFLYRVEQRHKAVEHLLADAIDRDPESRVIIFHESIAEVMSIFNHLRKLGYRVVAEHSELSDRLRAQAISLFRQGVAQIIVSAKSLIEGFNVPSADIGIVVAASSSVRQRVQTLGRLLRRGSADVAKRARLIVLFAEKTVDEMIYEKADWNGFVGAERNEYFRWTNVKESSPQRVASAPREYIPSDAELSADALSPGTKYPGKLEGDIFTIDTGGTVLDAQRRAIKLNSEIMSQLQERPGGGRFLVTPKQHHVVRLSRGMSGSEAIYLGRLSQPLRPAGRTSALPSVDLRPGAEYPIEYAAGTTFSVLQRDQRLIARKKKGLATFVRRVDSIADPEKRSRLESIQAELRNAYRKGHLISRIFVNEFGHVGYLFQGRAYFLGNAPEGSAGFSFEE